MLHLEPSGTGLPLLIPLSPIKLFIGQCVITVMYIKLGGGAEPKCGDAVASSAPG